jgi:hypothetical protein
MTKALCFDFGLLVNTDFAANSVPFFDLDGRNTEHARLKSDGDFVNPIQLAASSLWGEVNPHPMSG